MFCLFGAMRRVFRGIAGKSAFSVPSAGKTLMIGGMKRIGTRFWTVSAAALFLLLFPSAGEESAARAAKQPWKLVCDEPVFDFGRIDPSAVITNVFTLRNEGNLTFVMKYVRTSCSCTQARMNKWVIGPGETARLTAVYTAARRRGPQKKALMVMGKDGEEPALILYLKGFVEPPVESDYKER
jgi:hypothetical protein